MFDIVIKNGQVIDGTGKKAAFRADIGISEGKIASIDPKIPESKGRVVVDALGQSIAPGFIDIQNHSDSYWTLFDQPSQLSLLTQGITTAIIGNCGSSLAPLTTPDSIKTIQKWHNLAGLNINWSTFEELIANINLQKTGINFGSLVGHATLRRGLVGDKVRKATSDEIQIMDKLLRTSMESGAFGLSLGLVYAHEVNSSMVELMEIAKTAKSMDGYVSIHLRNESGRILDALDEAIQLALQMNLRVKISHLKIRGKQNWHLEGSVINVLEKAFHRGLDISFDTYPYHTSWTVLYTYLPKWAYEGGRDGILKLLQDTLVRRKIIDHLKSSEYDYNQIIVAFAQNNPGFVGKTIKQIASNTNVTEEEALLNIIAACNVQAVVFDHNLSDEQVDNFLSSPLSMIATDGAGYSEQTFDLVHPRCFGTMPRFLKWVRESGLIDLPEAIRKITSEPARVLGMKNRGTIFAGAVADLTVFDPHAVSDEASYSQPFQFSTGIGTVIIGGKLAYHNNSLQGLHGSFLRKQ